MVDGIGRKRAKYDLDVMYRILLAVKESPKGYMNLTDIVKTVKISYSTAEKYIEVLKKYGLVDERIGRERRIYLTRKGIDYIFLYTRLLALMDETN